MRCEFENFKMFLWPNYNKFGIECGWSSRVSWKNTKIEYKNRYFSLVKKLGFVLKNVNFIKLGKSSKFDIKMLLKVWYFFKMHFCDQRFGFFHEKKKILQKLGEKPMSEKPIFKKVDGGRIWKYPGDSRVYCYFPSQHITKLYKTFPQ